MHVIFKVLPHSKKKAGSIEGINIFSDLQKIIFNKDNQKLIFMSEKKYIRGLVVLKKLTQYMWM